MDMNQNTASVAEGEMASLEKKLCQLSVRNILDFEEYFEETKWEFRALFEFIGTADLTNFAQQESLRYGLERLFMMCLEKQEKHVEELLQITRNSPECYLERARNITKEVEEGAFIDPQNNRLVLKAIENMDLILSMFGEERYPEAEIIRKKLLSKIKVS